MALRVVLDTNVYISAILFGGVPEKVIKLASKRTFALYTSQQILDELGEVLSVKFRLSSSELGRAKQWIMKSARLVSSTMTVTDCSDPDDNRVLECALQARADVIVSGDRHLLGLHPYNEILILKPASFLAILSRE